MQFYVGISKHYQGYLRQGTRVLISWLLKEFILEKRRPSPKLTKSKDRNSVYRSTPKLVLNLIAAVSVSSKTFLCPRAIFSRIFNHNRRVLRSVKFKQISPWKHPHFPPLILIPQKTLHGTSTFAVEVRLVSSGKVELTQSSPSFCAFLLVANKKAT